MTRIQITAAELTAALRDGRGRVVAPARVAYDAGGCVNSGAAWPSFDLEVDVDGLKALTIAAWKVASWDDRGNWTVELDDGHFRGFRGAQAINNGCEAACPPECDGGDGCRGWAVMIEGGDNLAISQELPCGGEWSLEAALLAALEIGDALRVACEAVEVEEPDCSLLDGSDVPSRGLGSWEYISRGLGVQIGAAMHPIITTRDNDGYDWLPEDTPVSGVVWLVHGLPRLTAERYETYRKARRAAEAEIAEAISTLAEARYVAVTAADAREAGACREGIARTEALIRARYHLAADAEITADLVLALLPDDPAARRACVIAALRR